MSATPEVAVESPVRPSPPPELLPEVVLTVEGVFDGATAWELRRSLEEIHAARGGQVVLDFTRVREFYDFGVAVLAHGLAQRTASQPKVILRGLRTHQMRMLRYFGIDA